MVALFFLFFLFFTWFFWKLRYIYLSGTNSMSNKILVIDGYNMIHRCRFQWGGALVKGDNQIVYNFFRVLKATVAEFSPDVVYFPLDGLPKARIDIDESYKANRAIDNSDPEVVAYWKYFREQKRKIISLLKRDYPIRVVSHPNQECDDLVNYIVKYIHPDDDVVIVSSDTDFIQILNEFPSRVKLYNPVSKKYRQNTPYDYVAWKAMVGDKADNVAGVRGIGPKTAEKILLKEGALKEKLESLGFREPYQKSYNLIKFIDLKDEEDKIMITSSDLDIDSIEGEFEIMGFKSMLKEEYFSSYEQEFLKLKR